jgi:large subunit ribosomal protein L2
MPLKTFKPTSPGIRNKALTTGEEITVHGPHKPLTRPLKERAGRDRRGRISVRSRGGRHKRLYRIIDFKRDKIDVPGKVATVEYDPNRSARIALVYYADGEKRYVLAPHGLKVGDAVLSSNTVIDAKVGNAMPLEHIPPGMQIHNIELRPGKGGQLVRSAGNAATIEAKEGAYAVVRLPSKRRRLILLRCRATIGQVGNPDHEGVSSGKAGRSRWLGRRPHVRGVAMNPVDHPLGGGEGKASGGRHPSTPWGAPTKGYKTRRNKRTKRFQLK